jgi:hypothetical protein
MFFQTLKSDLFVVEGQTQMKHLSAACKSLIEYNSL